MTGKATRVLALRLWLISCPLIAGPAIDEKLLPPPAPKTIDFPQDIKPILENTCLRCHGAEKPKSGFRLTDRASALKGGANGVDIIPGQSAKSPLIHYVARLVPDMEMPPEGKGTPLSSNAVSLLRAWIDQGLRWNDAVSATSAVTSVTVSPVAGTTLLHGDRAKFRELEWRPAGGDGGLENFDLSEKWPDGRAVSAAGHVLRDDYRVTLDLAKPDLGFTRFGFEQYRKYYEDAGGYYRPFSPALYRLPEEPRLDLGRVWFEVGLTLPDWPRIVAAYEHQFRNGTKSMLAWGRVLAPGNTDPRNIYPSVEQLDEDTHIFRLDLAFSSHGFEFEDNLRAELSDASTRRTDALNVLPGAAAPDVLTLLQQRHESTHIANTARLQKEFYDWWLAGVGYRYSWFDTDAQLSLTPQDGAGRPTAGSAWSGDNIVLKEVWQVANANSQFRIHPQLTATLGVQGEWKRQEAFGNANLDEVTFDPNDLTLVRFPFAATEHSTLDQETAEESLVLRHTGLPFTSLFAEARLKQEDYTRTADQVGGPHNFAFASDAVVHWQDYRVGFSSAPWTRVSFGGHYRFRDRQTDYDYPLVPGGAREGAYPGFITARSVIAQEIEPRLAVRPANWLKTTLTYQWSDSDFRTTTRPTTTNDFADLPTSGGRILAGRNNMHTASLNASLTPFRRVYFAATVSYQHSRVTTSANGNASIAPYMGDIWSILASGTCVLTEATDLFAAYSFSQARYAQNNTAAGLPLGIDYDRHGVQVGLRHSFSRAVTGRVQYGYFRYDEPSSGHLTDFTAHQVLAVVALRW